MNFFDRSESIMSFSCDYDDDDDDESISYSPLESPQSQNDFFKFASVNYLDMFGECIFCINDMLDVIDCVNGLVESTVQKCNQEVNKSKQITITNTPVTPTAVTSKSMSKKQIKRNNYFHVNFDDDLDLFLKLKKKTAFQTSAASAIVFNKENNESVVDKLDRNLYQFKIYFFNVIKVYLNSLKNVEIDNKEELTVDMAQMHLNDYFSNRAQSTTTIDLDLNYLLMINLCFTILDLLFNCSFNTVLWFMNTLTKKYENLIRNEYEKISFKVNELNEKNVFNHPKIENLCNYISRKSKENANSKFLIVLSKNLPPLINDIKEGIEKVNELNVFVVDSDQQQVDIDFNSHKCVLITKNIKLSELCIRTATSIIEYESMPSDGNNNETSTWSKIGSSYSIEYLSYSRYAIKLTNIGHQPSQQSIEEEQQSRVNEVAETDASPIVTIKNKDIILSTRLIESKPYLVEFFEGKLELCVYERDYLNLCKLYNLKYIEHADVLINQYTGVIIIDAAYLDTHVLAKRLNYLKYQLDFVYLIICTFDNHRQHKNREVNMDEAMLNLANLTYKIEYLKTKVVNVSKIMDLEDVLVKILANPLKKNNSEMSESPPQLSVEPMISEIFLLSSCCFNSYSAQSLLNAYNFNNILSMQSKEVENNIKNCSFVSFRIIENFYKIVAKSTKKNDHNTEDTSFTSTSTTKKRCYNFKKQNLDTDNIAVAQIQASVDARTQTTTQTQSNFKLTYEKPNINSTQTCLVFKKK